jgi:hypothetical protein
MIGILTYPSYVYIVAASDYHVFVSKYVTHCGNIKKYKFRFLSSPTNGGRSVGIARWRTKATELVGWLVSLSV